MATFKAYSPLIKDWQAITDHMYLCESRIQISGLTAGAAQSIILKTGSSAIFTRTFYPLGSTVEIDIHNDIADYLKLTPDIELQPSEYISLTLTAGGTSVGFYMHISEMENTDQGGESQLTDIETISIPRTAKLPLAVYNALIEDQDDPNLTVPLYVITNRRKTFVKNVAFDNSDCYQMHLFQTLDVASLPVADGDAFRLEWGTAEEENFTPVPSPTYRVVPGDCEQYLFLNRYGVWDLIPMYGALAYSPEHTITTGSDDSSRFRIQATLEPSYTQNTGHLSRKTLQVLADLMCSRQIFHLLDGVWQEIIVDETELEQSSADSVHSGTFKYRYADKTVKNENL